MPTVCCVCKVPFRKGSGRRFFRVPNDRLLEWTANIRTSAGKPVDWIPSVDARVCSDHFVSGQKSDKKSDVDWAPTVFRRREFGRELQNTVCQDSCGQDTRASSASGMVPSHILLAEQVTAVPQLTQEHQDEHAAPCQPVRTDQGGEALGQDLLMDANTPQPLLQSTTSISAEVPDLAMVDTGVLGQGAQHGNGWSLESSIEVSECSFEPHLSEGQADTSICSAPDSSQLSWQQSMEEKYVAKCREADALRMENARLSAECKFLLTQKENMKCEAENARWCYNSIAECKVGGVSYCTGIPNDGAFLWVVNLYRKAGGPCTNRLTCEDEVLFVLMRLRLDVDLCFLAQIFKVPVNLASSLFEQGITLLKQELQGLILWPDEEAFLAFQPKSFRRRFRNVRVIVDCTEVKCERASCTTTQSTTWSNYKNTNTVKYLIGITPNGLISFVSESWGGKISDKDIFLRSSIMDHLEHGDVVMADRGFNIARELAAYGVQVLIPAFTKGKPQLTKQEVTASREISKRRIRVEQVIGRMKRFKLLRHTIPYHMKDYIDDIVTVIAALTNLLREF